MSWLRLIEESMKAKTPSVAAGGDEVPSEATAAGNAFVSEPAPKPEKPAPKARTRDRFRHLLSDMWPAYLIEIVVIMLGISITLALEQWRDGAKEDQLEKIYRGNLAADITPLATRPPTLSALIGCASGNRRRDSKRCLVWPGQYRDLSSKK